MTQLDSSMKPVSEQDCTLCGLSVPSSLIEHWYDAKLCQSCFRTHQDALRVEEETTQPWTIDALSEADWQAQLLTRRTAYRESLTATQ